MKFDNIIIGGGLSGLTCGIALAKAGRKVAVVAAGQSTLHFNSGSISLLGYDNAGKTVTNPLEEIPRLSENHPYRRVADVAARAKEAAQLLEEAGLKMQGDAARNHFRLTPMGITKPAWLTIDGFATTEAEGKLPYAKVTLANIRGFLDWPTEFLADNLRKMGVEVEMLTFGTPLLDSVRRSPSEMRATNIAKLLNNDDQLAEVAQAINTLNATGEVILLPAVLGIASGNATNKLRQQVRKPIAFVATMPPSVPGVRIQTQLIKLFQSLGGTYLRSDIVTKGTLVRDKVAYIETENLQDERLYADDYVLCTGSFQSRGLRSDFQHVYEPVFGLDVDADESRANWHADYAFDAQPYMAFGVRTDATLHPLLGGKPVHNLYAAGAVLSGHNALKLDDGTGVSMLTALEVAHNILSK